jgi:predicted ATP-dependent protease
LVNNKQLKGAPVVYETNPTFQNIMGYFEYEEIRNSLFTDFTKLKPGALHKANGGFLILQANDLLKNYYAWTALKRALRNRTLKMEEIESDFKYKVNITPKPQEVPLDLKVLIIGDEEIYHMLYNYDEDFRRIFRVKADFDSNAKANSKNIKYLIEFISRIVKEDCSLDFDMSAIRRIIFHTSKKAEDQKKIRIHSGELVDIIIESDFWAKKAKKKIVSEEFVKKAIKNKEKRHGKVKDYYLESIERDTILIETKKSEIGKINGLAVYSIGDYSFGLPSRITARVFAGKRGIINIDREVRLSGSIHDKGSMILAGFIGGVFAQDKTLGISASITFEQSYGGVDGDSASSTELYVLLSALGKIPIKQSIAVTGSINQMGEIQPIGGVNEKVEGFFEICKMKGFAKEGNGVIIPIQNVENLNLSDEVIEAVEKGIFTIYAIKTVYEGIEILTGIKAGERKKDGTFSKNSVFDKVNQRIIELNNIE